jgi:hypothetical protein
MALVSFGCQENGGGGDAGDTLDVSDDVGDSDSVSDVVDSQVDAACGDEKWRDHFEGSCLSCTDATLTCESFEFSQPDLSASQWNGEDKTLRLAILPGQTELVSVMLSGAVREDTGQVTGGTPISEAAQIDGNEFVFNLGTHVSEGEVLDVTRLRFEDACDGVLVIDTSEKFRPGQDKTLEHDCSGASTGG